MQVTMAPPRARGPPAQPPVRLRLQAPAGSGKPVPLRACAGGVVPTPLSVVEK